MNVTLTERSEALIQEELAQGTAITPEELIEQALEMFHVNQAWPAESADEIREHVAKGVAEARRGELIPGDLAREQVRVRWSGERNK